jgi:Flp pilus assembly protein TadD
MTWRRFISFAILSLGPLTAGGCGGGGGGLPDPAWPGEPASPRAEIVVDFTRAHDGRVPVSMRIVGVKTQPYRFLFKAKEGEYRMHDVRFADGSGRPILHELKRTKYTLEPFEGDVVQANWEAEPGGLGRHGHQGAIRGDFATFDGRLFLMPQNAAALRAARIHFAVPKGWTVATPFRREGDWFYLDSFKPKDTSRLLQKTCYGVGRFDVETRRFGDMEVRVASYAKWNEEHKAKITESTFGILEYFHETFDFDLRSPYLVVWTPRIKGRRVHGGSGVAGTCLQNPNDALRPYQLLGHRVAHCMNKYHPAGMQVADPVNRWFKEGWPSYMEVVVTEATGVAKGRSHFNTLYTSYGSTLRTNPGFDLALAREPRVKEPATEFIHYKKGPLVTKMLADLVQARSGHTLEEFMRAMWAEYGWYQGRFELKEELESFTGATYDDFWKMMVHAEGRAVPVWDDYLTREIRGRMKREPAAHVGDEPISGPYLHYLASSGEFRSFEQVRQFLVAESIRRRVLAERGVSLYPDEIRRHVFALPPWDRLAIARYELSYPLGGGPGSLDAKLLELNRSHPDGRAFAELVALEAEYLAARSRTRLAALDLRAVDGPASGKSRLAFGADATLLLVPKWRSLPEQADVEVLSGDEVIKSWTVDRNGTVRVKPTDRPARNGVMAFRVSGDGEEPVTRAFWQRGFEKDGLRTEIEMLRTIRDPSNPNAWLANGVRLTASGEYGPALESLAKAILMDPGDEKKWNQKGETLALAGRHLEAVEAFDHALALNPRFMKAAGNEALALADLDKREESLAALALLVETHPEADSRHHWEGRVLERLGDREAAIGPYRTFAELQPNRPSAWRNLGHCLLNAQRLEEAVAAFDRALQLDPTDERAGRERRAALSGLKHGKR